MDETCKGATGKLDAREKVPVCCDKILGENGDPAIVLVSLGLCRRNKCGKDCLVVCRKDGTGQSLACHAGKQGAVKKLGQVLAVKADLGMFARNDFGNSQVAKSLKQGKRFTVIESVDRADVLRDLLQMENSLLAMLCVFRTNEETCRNGVDLVERCLVLFYGPHSGSHKTQEGRKPGGQGFECG